MSMVSKVKQVLNALVRRSYWYNNIEFADCSKFWKHNTFNLDVINLGSSSALAAFDYSDYSQLKAANWAMAPQTTLADYEVLRNYCCYLRKGATVIIPLCPFTCLGGSKDNFADKYYTVLDIASIPHASYIKKQQVMERKQNPILYYPLMQLFTRRPKQKQTVWDEELLVKDAKMRMESWRKEFSIIRFSDPLSLVNQDAYDDTATILKKMVSFCIERSYRPVLVMPPVSKALQSQFTSELKQLCIDGFVAKAVGNDVKFLNFFTDERFTNEHFQHSFMLNVSGAKLFTEVVMKEIGL